MNWSHFTHKRTTSILDIYKRYLVAHSLQVPELGSLLDQTGDNADIGDRRTFPIHVTASGLVYDPTRRSLLLIMHRTLGLWLQPGGHLEEGELPSTAARREVIEEVNPSTLTLWGTSDVPLNIDIHPIPENEAKAEPSHYHCDFRYLFFCSCESVSADLDEVAAAAWFPIQTVGGLSPTLMPLVRLIEAIF